MCVLMTTFTFPSLCISSLSSIIFVSFSCPSFIRSLLNIKPIMLVLSYLMDFSVIWFILSTNCFFSFLVYRICSCSFFLQNQNLFRSYNMLLHSYIHCTRESDPRLKWNLADSIKYLSHPRDQSLVHLVFVAHFYSLNQCVPFQAFVIYFKEVVVRQRKISWNDS